MSYCGYCGVPVDHQSSHCCYGMMMNQMFKNSINERDVRISAQDTINIARDICSSERTVRIKPKKWSQWWR